MFVLCTSCPADGDDNEGDISRVKAEQQAMELSEISVEKDNFNY